MREGDNQYLYEAYFTVDEATLTQESVMLTHSGIAQPGVYEIVINHTANRDSSYQQAYVPRVSITVVEAE